MDPRAPYWGASEQHSLIVGGPHARAIAQLFWIYVALLSLVAVLVMGSVGLAIWRRRARTAVLQAPALRAGELEPGEPAIPLRRLDEAPEARRRRKVIISSAATLLALFVLLAESVGTSNALEALSGGEQLEIQVTGKQWWWQIRYLDETPAKGFSTANELHIPIGRSVRLQLSAADVIHSFWAPSLNGKRDLIPGHDNQLVLKADRAGRYRAQCAEFCGGAHAQMALWVIAEPERDFAAWCSHQREAAAEPATDVAREGRAVFLRSQCPSCHAIGGTDAQSQIGPDLTHFASRLGLAAASFPNRRGFLAGWIVGAQGMKPGSHMPNLMLEPQELQALLTFLEGLR